MELYRFTLSPDSAFPSNHSRHQSSSTDSPQSSSAQNLGQIRSDVEQHNGYQSDSIEYCFPPAASRANSDAQTDSASSSPFSPRPWGPDRVDEGAITENENKTSLLKLMLKLLSGKGRRVLAAEKLSAPPPSSSRFAEPAPDAAAASAVALKSRSNGKSRLWRVSSARPK